MVKLKKAEIPNLIDLQKKSYDRFLQMDVPEGEREDTLVYKLLSKASFRLPTFKVVQA